MNRVHKTWILLPLLLQPLSCNRCSLATELSSPHRATESPVSRPTCKVEAHSHSRNVSVILCSFCSLFSSLLSPGHHQELAQGLVLYSHLVSATCILLSPQTITSASRGYPWSKAGEKNACAPAIPSWTPAEEVGGASDRGTVVDDPVVGGCRPRGFGHPVAGWRCGRGSSDGRERRGMGQRCCCAACTGAQVGARRSDLCLPMSGRGQRVSAHQRRQEL